MLLPSNDPKYAVSGGRFINRASGEAIPDDEPVFIFRARDRWALEALYAYLDNIYHDSHKDAVLDTVYKFQTFAKEYPERMKEPDTSVTDNTEGEG